MERTEATSATSNKMLEMERITHENQANSPLLRLPPELRTEIYKYTLTDGRLVMKYPHCSFVPDSSNPRGARALLYTCRQIHHEAASLVMPCCVVEIIKINVFDVARTDEDVFPNGLVENYRLSRAQLTESEHRRFAQFKAIEPWESKWLSLKRLFLEMGTRWSIEEAGLKLCWLFGRGDLEVLWVDEE
ncbi:hypothetical protein P3342_009561 [Pyrenophora teres f. teres]|uniref:2EXR domain-containing protein n=2 Tax=Pyrenophora teres f. teres TaxID=97479 RepID=E3RZ48_PYRTT|nr:hypothetical protein PTT_14888 [Pyrenophora teres f. teres 0-1]KAE8825695.1 hypothetical protein HRS9139_08805 [Pyrenophora teres f. teres]KAE8834792.1 hypothetical protein PTNB85_06125 [Pyrenophora teres f. teres]KAE8843731.1 hypothetical protein HRS9122_04834 [Pyrenophora teres f. teres]KAE8859212.1 hypothetical protein PTNB73_08692 [Pyrenophora teres f. teres]